MTPHVHWENLVYLPTLRCGWVLWVIAAYILLLVILMLFFKGCSISEAEESELQPCQTKPKKQKVVTLRPRHLRGGHAVSAPKFTPELSDTSGQSSSGTKARPRNSKTARSSS